jgi:hypothetical protein
VALAVHQNGLKMAQKIRYLNEYLDSQKMLGSKAVCFFMLGTMAQGVHAQLPDGGSQTLMSPPPMG